MKTDSKTRKYIIGDCQEVLSHYAFYLRVHECAVEFLKPYIGKTVTLREAKKLLNEIQKAYPETQLYFQNEKWGRSARYYLRTSTGREACRQEISIESLTSERIYTHELWERQKTQAAWAKEHYETQQAVLDNINELIDLEDKQETEREELQARQELERETFKAQTKCPQVDLSSTKGRVEERLSAERKEEYYQNLERERLARVSE